MDQLSDEEVQKDVAGAPAVGPPGLRDAGQPSRVPRHLSSVFSPACRRRRLPIVLGTSTTPRRSRRPAKRGEKVMLQSMKSGRIEVRGISYYYEIRGLGEPLLL